MVFENREGYTNILVFVQFLIILKNQELFSFYQFLVTL